MYDFLLRKPVALALEIQKHAIPQDVIRTQHLCVDNSAHLSNTASITEATLHKENPEPFEFLFIEWYHAFQNATSEPEAQMANTRFILQLFLLEQPCHVFDCEALSLTQGNPEKQVWLQDLLEWIGVYLPLQEIKLHSEDGALSPPCQQVLKEHHFLHHALSHPLEAQFLYCVPQLEDMLQQALLTAYYLLDRLGLLLLTPSITQPAVSNWMNDDSIINTTKYWPMRLKNMNREMSSALQAANPKEWPETETSLFWKNCEHAIQSVFTAMQMTIQKKLQARLDALESMPSLNNKTSITTFLRLYQTYQKDHASILKLYASSWEEHVLISTDVAPLAAPSRWLGFLGQSNAPPTTQSPAPQVLDQSAKQKINSRVLAESMAYR